VHERPPPMIVRFFLQIGLGRFGNSQRFPAGLILEACDEIPGISATFLSEQKKTAGLVVTAIVGRCVMQIEHCFSDSSAFLNSSNQQTRAVFDLDV
jgi:hypothetical protein